MNQMICLVVHSLLVKISSLMFVFADMMLGIIDNHHDAFLLTENIRREESA